MRIHKREAGKVDKKTNKNRSVSDNKSESSTIFDAALSQTENDFKEYELELNTLKNEIYDAGDNLDKEPSLKNFKEFRDLIRTLMKKVSTDAYKIKQIKVPFRSVSYEVIQTVNRELDELYRLIMREQKNRISVTNKVIRLKGLVVDVLK